MLSIFTVSTSLGIFGYKRYIDSEKIILESLKEFDNLGKIFQSEECITEILKWNKSCLAMKSLCDHSVPRLMNVCLKSQNRFDECQKFVNIDSDSKVGVTECNQRGVLKKEKKNCTTAYMVWKDYCQNILFANAKTTQ